MTILLRCPECGEWNSLVAERCPCGRSLVKEQNCANGNEAKGDESEVIVISER